MSIRKKSPDTLRQQKNSFLNFIKTKERYSAAIADLFFDDEIEKIDNMDGVKEYLEKKGMSKTQIDFLNKDYELYLKNQYIYGRVNDYPEEVKKLIKENEKILNKIKKDIIKLYNEGEKYINFDVEKFVDNEFVCPDVSSLIDIGSRHELEWKINTKEKEKIGLERDVEDKNRELNGLEYQLEKCYWFQIGKKKKIKERMEKLEQGKKNKEDEIQSINSSIKEYKDKEKIVENVEKISKRDFSDILRIMGNDGKYTDIDRYKQAIKRINIELENYLIYMSEENIKNIKTNIVKIIEKNRDNAIKQLKLDIEKLLEEYLNYFNYGENKNRYSIKTVFSKNRIDLQIMEIVNKLGIKISNNDLFNNGIDYDFMDDVFIHTTGFNVLDEILEEGGLISTNEAWKRSRQNSDLNDSITQKYTPHKDIYFSRGFRKNGYGYHERNSEGYVNDDFVFIANTMNNFAESGYGVPLSNRMQPNAGLDDVRAAHDTYGYSIISKSALDGNDYSYSKIDVKDFYIFVLETKKKEIESNPKYNLERANIIYIPEEYKGMSYKLYEFIKNEIALRDKEKIKKSPIPRKIIDSSSGIKSIRGGYTWAFCDSVGDMPEILFNPLKNCDDKKMLDFLKKNQNDLLSRLNIDFQRLEEFLNNQKDNIEHFGLPFEYPKELVLLTVICVKLGLGSYNSDQKRYSLVCIKNKLKEFGYTMKELSIFCEAVGWICNINEYKDNIRRNESGIKSNLDEIKKWCGEWSVNFDEMKEFLVNISNISLRTSVSDFVKDILK